MTRWIVALLLTITLAATAQSPQPVKDDPPETVVATFYLRPEKVDDFFKMMPEYWQLLRKLDLVEPEPGLLLRGEDSTGKPIAMQVFTWKHSSTPDNAPPDVQKYWNQINDMVEKRDGHQGIEFPEMHIVPMRK
jgi:hypothetical protein